MHLKCNVTMYHSPEFIPITKRPDINMYGWTANDSKPIPTIAIILFNNIVHFRPMKSARAPAGKAPNIPPTAKIDAVAAHSAFEYVE